MTPFCCDGNGDDGVDGAREEDADGFGEWQIKADREEITDAEHDIESLQKETSQAMADDHEHAKK